MSLGVRAIDKLIRGALKYRTTGLNHEFRAQMARLREEFLPKHPRNQAIFITCMDARLHPSSFTQTSWSNAIFRLRNPGNFIPNAEIRQHTEASMDKSDSATDTVISSELAALDLVIGHGAAQQIVVCGHSDCRAMSLLYKIQEEPFDPSPLEACIHHYGSPTLRKWHEYNKDKKRPIKFLENLPEQSFEAIIDPNGDWSEKNKLSQINVLQQLENIGSHPNLRPVLVPADPESRVHLHGMWYEIESAEIWYFDKKSRMFRLLDDDLAEFILSRV